MTGLGVSSSSKRVACAARRLEEALLIGHAVRSTEFRSDTLSGLNCEFHPPGTTTNACGIRPRPDCTRRSRPPFTSRMVIRWTVRTEHPATVATFACRAKNQTRLRLMAQVAPVGPASAEYAIKIAFSVGPLHAVAAHAAKNGLGLCVGVRPQPAQSAVLVGAWLQARQGRGVGASGLTQVWRRVVDLSNWLAFSHP